MDECGKNPKHVQMDIKDGKLPKFNMILEICNLLYLKENVQSIHDRDMEWKFLCGLKNNGIRIKNVQTVVVCFVQHKII